MPEIDGNKKVTLEELKLVHDLKLNKDFSGMTALPQSPANSDLLAIQNGSTTYKVPVSAILDDVYRKSQTYSKNEAVAKADIVDSLTSTATDKPLSANQGQWLKSYLDEAICIYELSFSNISVPTLASTSVSYSFPQRDGYSRAFLSPPFYITGSGSGLVIVTIHGDASGGSIHLGSATSNAITVATLKIRCVYVKNGIYKNITPAN